jgi:hypothetical protein
MKTVLRGIVLAITLLLSCANVNAGPCVNKVITDNVLKSSNVIELIEISINTCEKEITEAVLFYADESTTDKRYDYVTGYIAQQLFEGINRAYIYISTGCKLVD